MTAKYLLVGAVALLLIPPSKAQSQSFTNVAGNNSDESDVWYDKDGGCSFQDFDKDGDLDLLVNSNSNSSSRRSYLLRNNDGIFDDVTSAIASDLKSRKNERSAVWGDFDNDGFPDLATNTSNRIRIYRNTGGTGLVLYLEISSITNGMNSEGMGWIDYDNDGHLDLLVENHNKGIDLFRNDGSLPYPNFDHVTSNSVGAAGQGAGGLGLPQGGSGDADYASTVDLDADGYVDIIARRRNNGSNNGMDNNPYDIFFNDGDGTFSPLTTFNETTVNSNKGGVMATDLDNDGDLDLVWTSASTDNNRLRIFEQTGLNSRNFQVVSNPLRRDNNSLETGNRFDGCAAGDIDNDGDIDLFFTYNWGTSALFLNESSSPGNFSFRQPGPISTGSASLNNGINVNGNAEACVFVDYDNDGDLDLYVNRDNGNQLWQNDLIGSTAESNSGITNAYLRVILQKDLGSGVTRSAIGASAVLKNCNGDIINGRRQVGGGSGHGSQASPWLHFGLGMSPSSEYVLEVTFPRSGNLPVTVTKVLTPSDLSPISGGSNLSLEQTLIVKDSDPSDIPTPCVEICDNGIDDDWDGLTDCLDPDCFGVGSCPTSMTESGGIINSYVEVQHIECQASGIITVTNSSGLSVGDEILIIQMKGAIAKDFEDNFYGDVNALNGAGAYEFATIAAINGNDITLEAQLVNDYDVTGLVQIVSVPQYEIVNLSSTLSPAPWNGSTGGVVVMEADEIYLGSDIDASGLGFRGGRRSDNDWSYNNAGYASTYASGQGGEKGESVAIPVNNRTAGRGHWANGGGGGNGHNAGGGGGSHAGSGGHGGVWSSQPYYTRGIGGEALDSHLTDRLILGGGGGGGEQNNSMAGMGGNGGGIIIIRANTIHGGGYGILANGQAGVDAPSNDGSGGGGAAGSILLDVQTINGALSLSARGGKGGDNFAAHGPGGGGGGGTIRSTQAFSASTTVDVSGGDTGTDFGNPRGATSGTPGSSSTSVHIIEGSLATLDPSACVDTDNDGVPDISDVDDDGDGLPDNLECPQGEDNDDDGLDNCLDIDSDGDGIPDLIESQSTENFVAPSGIDTDGDGLDDAYDNDCQPCGNIYGSPITPYDHDGAIDGLPDYLDYDSDEDGTMDYAEAWDTDFDGSPEIQSLGVDTDQDGLDDAFDRDSGLMNSTGADNGMNHPNELPDIDNDGQPNWRDGITALPIELLAFDAESRDDHVLLSWITAAEINNDFFTIERSDDAQDWEEIGTMDGAGNSSNIELYEYKDFSPLNGISYYRLKQTDFDGQFEYFDPDVVERKNSLEIRVYPNPARSHVNIYSEDIEKAEVRLLDTGGSEIQVYGEGFGNLYRMNLHHVQSGNYLLMIIQNEQTEVRILTVD